MERKKRSSRRRRIHVGPFRQDVHRLVLAFLRAGNFLTGRCPGGAACGDGVPIVKMALPLLPGVWV